MSARFVHELGCVVDRQNGVTVCAAIAPGWASMIADGLNIIVDQVMPWDPRAGHLETLDGEVVTTVVEQPAIGL